MGFTRALSNLVPVYGAVEACAPKFADVDSEFVVWEPEFVELGSGRRIYLEDVIDVYLDCFSHSFVTRHDVLEGNFCHVVHGV